MRGWRKKKWKMKQRIKTEYSEILNDVMDALVLISRSPEIINATIIIAFLTYIPELLRYSPLRPLGTLVSLFLVFIVFGYDLALPRFLKLKNEGKKLEFKEIYRQSIINARKLIGPVILLSILGAVIFLLIALIAIVFFKENNSNILPESYSVFLVTMISIVISFFNSFWIFTTVLFSSSGGSIIKTYVKGIKYSFKNFYLSSIIIGSYIIYYILTLNSEFKNLTMINFVLALIMGLLHLLLVTTTLFYFGRKNKLLNKVTSS